MNRTCLKIISVFVFVLINGFFIAPFFAIYIRILFEENYKGFAIYSIILFSIGLLLSWICYFKTTFTNPGYVVKKELSIDEENKAINLQAIKNDSINFKQQLKQNNEKLNSIEIQMINSERDVYNQLKLQWEELNQKNDKIYQQISQQKTYCLKCDLIRPKRSHHCSVCRRCVKRMDHHCPFLGNCIGEKNIRFFTQFLFYSSLTILVNFIQSIAFSFSKGFDNNSIFIFYISGFVGLFFGLSQFVFFIFHVQLILRNTTTLEQDYLREFNPFDQQSKVKNFEQIMKCKLLSIQTFLPLKSTFNQIKDSLIISSFQ